MNFVSLYILYSLLLLVVVVSILSPWYQTVIQKSLLVQLVKYLRLSRERPGFESPTESSFFLRFLSVHLYYCIIDLVFSQIILLSSHSSHILSLPSLFILSYILLPLIYFFIIKLNYLIIIILLLLFSLHNALSSCIVSMGVQLRWQSIRFACEGQRDRCPPPPLFCQI